MVGRREYVVKNGELLGLVRVGWDGTAGPRQPIRLFSSP